MNEGENEDLVSEDVDRCLLLRFPKDQRLWVGEGGDLELFGGLRMVFFLFWSSKLEWRRRPPFYRSSNF